LPWFVEALLEGQAMQRIIFSFLFLSASVVTAQSPAPLSDSRLSVNTLLREDIFAGLMRDDMERFTRGEKNIELLLEQRPAEKPVLLAWKAGATVYRAVRAFEGKRSAEFDKRYREALSLFAEAKKLGPKDLGVIAVMGGTYGFFGDRLPKEHRGAAWSQAYESYQMLWKQQAPFVDKLPVHLRGELLAGLAQSAQRTGHTKEADQYLDKILALLPDTPYERIAKDWKQNPASASRTRLTCQTCHAPGRLAARRAALDKE
jgi:tetratricopeptide (TPR) repeat protein